MRIIIAGSRTFNDYDLLKTKIDKFTRKLKTVVVLSGEANGADRLGEKWAKERGWQIERFPAEWEKHGRKAGIVRNLEMLESIGKKGCLIVFWDGVSRGTAHIVEAAKTKGIKTKIVSFKKEFK